MKINFPRNPIIAFLGSLIFHGFGQMYNGQIKKGILFLTIILILPFIYGFTRIGTSFIGFASILIIDISFRIYVIYDATITAKKLKNYSLKPYNTWYYYLLFLSVTSIFWFYENNRIIGIQSYHIPTTANEPTIQVDDRLVADLYAYKNSEPTYGDLVVFQQKDSLNPSMYRVIGLPGDNVKIENSFLIINNIQCKTTYIKETESEQFIVNEYEEELPNGHKHRIYTFKETYVNSNQYDIISEVDIPQNHYFLVGDNRDNAWDSRHIGLISKDEIIGKIVFGYFGNTLDRINLDYSN